MGTTLFLACLAAVSSVPARAQLPGLNTTTGVLRAKAAPDECWIGLDMNVAYSLPPCAQGTTKVNSGYVWALTDPGTGKIFFGTLANGQCVTEGGLTPTPPPAYVTDSWACEFGDSPYSKAPVSLLPGNLGDFRPPQIFTYDKSAKTVQDVTHHVTPSVVNPLGFDPLVESTLGIRAAVTVGNTVLLAGPSLFGSINFFAYNATTAALLWEYNLPCTKVVSDTYCYSNIRQFTTFQGQTYTAVAVTKNGTTIGGAALKLLTLSSLPCLTNCATFLPVGSMDGQGAYIASHDGRLYVSTWPSGLTGSVASLFMSPAVPAGGLITNVPWTKVWSVTQYDPDQLNEYGYSGGALADFDGYLYWGTIHAPWEATALFFVFHGAPATQQDFLTDVENTFQTAAVFRGTNFDTTPTIDLLYGYPYLPQFSSTTQSWSMVPNLMPAGHKDPLYGTAGFGNPYNNYIWSMNVWNNRLWVGTMDWSYMAIHGATAVGDPTSPPLNYLGLGNESAPFGTKSFINVTLGGDLMFFQDSNTPAIPESLTGVGNQTNYGVRNIVPNADSSSLFLGMANPMNLLTSLYLGTNKGGWELIELTPKTAGPVHTLTGLTCTPGNLTGPGVVTCTVTLDAPATGLGTLVALSNYPSFPLTIPGAPTLSLPANVWVLPGKTSATFSVAVPEVATATEAALEAELNGGTRFAGIQLAPGTAKISGTLNTPFLATSQIIGVPVKFTDNGTGEALNLTINSVTGSTLAGTGSVSFLGTLWPLGSPSTTLNLGTLGVGASRTVTFYFSVPSTVTRFSVTESGQFDALAGGTYSWSTSQSLFTSQAH